MWAVKEIPEKIKRGGNAFYLIDFPRDSWSFMHSGPGYFANHVNSHNGIWIHFQKDGLGPVDDFVNLKELQQWRKHNPRQPEAIDDH